MPSQIDDLFVTREHGLECIDSTRCICLAHPRTGYQIIVQHAAVRLRTPDTSQLSQIYHMGNDYAVRSHCVIHINQGHPVVVLGFSSIFEQHRHGRRSRYVADPTSTLCLQSTFSLYAAGSVWNANSWHWEEKT